MCHPDERPGIGQVLHSRDCRLRAQRRSGLGITLASELECRIIPQIIRIVAVLISRCDHHDPKPDDVLQAVSHLARFTQIGEARGDKTSQVVTAFDFPQERQTGIGAHLSAIEIEHDGLAIQG